MYIVAIYITILLPISALDIIYIFIYMYILYIELSHMLFYRHLFSVCEIILRYVLRYVRTAATVTIFLLQRICIYV
jgi:hypothetical protein